MNDDGCIFTEQDREIPLSVEKSQLSPRSSKRLHLYANIGNGFNFFILYIIFLVNLYLY